MKVNEQDNCILANRRQFARVRAQLAMQYRVLHEEGVARAWNSTMTKNLSAAGICFESFHPLSLNTLLEVNLKIPFFETPVLMKVRIIRAAEIKAGEIYGVAAAITEIKQSDRKKLQMELEQIDIIGLLQTAIEQGASDIHLSLGHPPMLRKAQELIKMDYDTLNKAAIRRMVLSLLTEEQAQQVVEKHDLTTAITIVTVTGTYRFRLNVHSQKDSIEAVFHLINMPVPNIKELKLPDIVSSFANKKAGLVLITGLGGSGKTTTCASLIQMINDKRSCVITMLERPIEHIFSAKNSIIRQREIPQDTESFAVGIRQAMQQDIDVLVLGELADLESAELALAAAEAGKLVFAVFSSAGVIASLERIINIFPQDRHAYIRRVLANCLQGVIFQKLIPAGKKELSLKPTVEILINTPDAAEALREGMFNKISSIIQTDDAS